jgi:hypothetical protein
MKFIPSIKRLWLRRCLMVVVTPLFAFQYMYLGLRSMVSEFKVCWNYQH